MGTYELLLRGVIVIFDTRFISILFCFGCQVLRLNLFYSLGVTFCVYGCFFGDYSLFKHFGGLFCFCYILLQSIFVKCFFFLSSIYITVFFSYFIFFGICVAICYSLSYCSDLVLGTIYSLMSNPKCYWIYSCANTESLILKGFFLASKLLFSIWGPLTTNSTLSIDSLEPVSMDNSFTSWTSSSMGSCSLLSIYFLVTFKDDEICVVLS